jgi:pimeloyl-ACP methyl ester carboxylesterase
MEQIFEFNNRNGQRLVGIVHSPDINSQNENIGVIFLQAGLKDRTGAHRIYVKLSRLLCKMGYFVFRFDSHGIGDSDGEMPKGLSIENFELIEKGCFSNDAQDAIKPFMDSFNIDRVMMAGICGGGITAMLAASADERIKNVVLLDVAVTMDIPENISNLHPTNVRIGFSAYLHKILQPGKWLRILTFRTDFKELWRIIVAYVTYKLTDRKLIKNNKTHIDTPLNVFFVEAFKNYMKSHRKVLFLMGETDAAWNFKTKFQNLIEQNSTYKSLCLIEYIETANHEFASLKAQDLLFRKISQWVQENM